ncbi:hypothetical protein B0H13DRAFT_2350102 [Mycena leptocephala]|nr:hypothetical protein B0H13DRAFT_2350102 [Mycena leptocephala]
MFRCSLHFLLHASDIFIIMQLLIPVSTYVSIHRGPATNSPLYPSACVKLHSGPPTSIYYVLLYARLTLLSALILVMRANFLRPLVLSGPSGVGAKIPSFPPEHSHFLR